MAKSWKCEIDLEGGVLFLQMIVLLIYAVCVAKPLRGEVTSAKTKNPVPRF